MKWKPFNRKAFAAGGAASFGAAIVASVAISGVFLPGSGDGGWVHEYQTLLAAIIGALVVIVPSVFAYWRAEAAAKREEEAEKERQLAAAAAAAATAATAQAEENAAEEAKRRRNEAAEARRRKGEPVRAAIELHAATMCRHVDALDETVIAYLEGSRTMHDIRDRRAKLISDAAEARASLRSRLLPEEAQVADHYWKALSALTHPWGPLTDSDHEEYRAQAQTLADAAPPYRSLLKSVQATAARRAGAED